MKEARNKRLHLNEISRIGKSTIEMECRLVVAGGWGGGTGCDCLMSSGFPEDENILELDRGGGYTTVWMYKMPLNCALSGSFYVMWIWSQLKIIFLKTWLLFLTVYEFQSFTFRPQRICKGEKRPQSGVESIIDVTENFKVEKDMETIKGQRLGWN